LPLDVLSSGTREAVFLSLRLALVADFSRRGIVLPLILDDVLVNFDRLRARNAARVLLDFADRGHQVLLFTCHEHIVELFTGAQVELRYLSDFIPSQRVAATPPQSPLIAEEPAVEPEEVPATDAPVETVEEDYDLADPVDEVSLEDHLVDKDDDEDYALGDAPRVLQPSPLEFLLEPDEESREVAIAAAEDDEYEDDEDAEYDDVKYAPEEADEEAYGDEESDEESVEEQQPVAGHRMQPRFAWESPERWWDANRGDEAA